MKKNRIKLPTLEVICTAYKRPGPLKVFVQSWLNQTANNWKLKVLHDGPDAEVARLMRDFVRREPKRISFNATKTRFNDYGHSLRAKGLKEATGDYILITNDDNYYVPRYLEFLNLEIQKNRPDVLMYDMVHSHLGAGGRPVLEYSYFATHLSRYNIDMGAAVVRKDLAVAAGFRDRTHDGDATYFEDVAAIGGEKLNLVKLNRVLFVHN